MIVSARKAVKHFFLRRICRVRLETATIWSAPAERSVDGALAPGACLATLEAVSPESFRGCHRTPHIPHTTNWVVVARSARAFCVLIFQRVNLLHGRCL